MEEEKNSKEANSVELKANIIEEKATEEEKQDEKNEIKKEEIAKYSVNEEKNFSKKRSKKKWIIITCIILIALAILSTGFALVNINNKNIIAGVTIDRINMQGLNKESAKEVISKKIEEKVNKEIKIKVDDEENTILLSQIELEYNVDDAINRAYSIGRRSNIFVNNFDIIKSKIAKTNITIETKYNEELLDNIIKDIKSKIPNGVQEVNFCVEGENLIITKGKK